MKYLIGLMALISGSAFALPTVEFNSIEANWQNPVGGNITLINPVDPSTDTTAQVRWGGPTATPLVDSSGYRWASRIAPFTENPLTVFELGIFTHFNNPIAAGTSISQVDLEITADFTLTATDGTEASYIGESFFFRFFHDETPNGASTCLYDENDGLSVPATGVNDNGCADLVTIQALSTSFVDPIFGLTLDLEGFSRSLADAQNGIYNDAFVSGEGSDNSAVLVAQFEVAEVPVTAPLALMGLGILGFATMRRKTSER